MGGGTGPTVMDLIGNQSDDTSAQEKKITEEQKLKKKLLEQQRIRLLRSRGGSLLDSMTDTGGRFLGG